MRRNVVASVLFTLFGGPGIVLLLVPWAITRLRIPADEPGAQRAAAALLVALGLAPLLESIVRFVRVGRGSLVPTVPPERLVASGLYRYVRNPMYLGVVAALAGEALLFRSRGHPGRMRRRLGFLSSLRDELRRTAHGAQLPGRIRALSQPRAALAAAPQAVARAGAVSSRGNLSAGSSVQGKRRRARGAAARRAQAARSTLEQEPMFFKSSITVFAGCAVLGAGTVLLGAQGAPAPKPGGAVKLELPRPRPRSSRCCPTPLRAG